MVTCFLFVFLCVHDDDQTNVDLGFSWTGGTAACFEGCFLLSTDKKLQRYSASLRTTYISLLKHYTECILYSLPVSSQGIQLQKVRLHIDVIFAVDYLVERI